MIHPKSMAEMTCSFRPQSVEPKIECSECLSSPNKLRLSQRCARYRTWFTCRAPLRWRAPSKSILLPARFNVVSVYIMVDQTEYVVNRAVCVALGLLAMRYQDNVLPLAQSCFPEDRVLWASISWSIRLNMLSTVQFVSHLIHSQSFAEMVCSLWPNRASSKIECCECLSSSINPKILSTL